MMNKVPLLDFPSDQISDLICYVPVGQTFSEEEREKFQLGSSSFSVFDENQDMLIIGGTDNFQTIRSHLMNTVRKLAFQRVKTFFFLVLGRYFFFKLKES